MKAVGWWSAGGNLLLSFFSDGSLFVTEDSSSSSAKLKEEEEEEEEAESFICFPRAAGSEEEATNEWNERLNEEVVIWLGRERTTRRMERNRSWMKPRRIHSFTIHSINNWELEMALEPGVKKTL